MINVAHVRRASVILCALVFGSSVVAQDAPPAKAGPGVKIAVRIDPKFVTSPPQTARVVVVLSRSSTGDLRGAIGRTGINAAPIFGTDAVAFTAAKPAVVDARSCGFPVGSLADLPAGAYTAQAVCLTNRDLNLVRAPGNLFSKPTKITLGGNETPTLELTEQEPPEKTPADTDRVKYLKFPSKLLSDFHGRPMFYRAAVVLPPDYATEPERKYPLRVQIGGFGSRYTMAGFLGRRDGPKMLTLFLDGAGPYGDPYQVNSANNGPYGDALTKELISYVEKTFRGIGQPWARFTSGGSTGGWVSLALQIFYPDFFGGCWSECPDPVDFRSYELIDIYRDANAYVNAHGFERPAKRDVNGDTIYSVRHECQVENVLGLGDRWQLGGRDWASWNAVFGPRGADGLPRPLWDPKTGTIDRTVTAHWEKYDLCRVVQKNWSTLGPKLNGKIHIWVGEADDYFLNNAVHHFQAMTRGLREPAFAGQIDIEIRKPHTSGWGEARVTREMAQCVERHEPAPAKAATPAAPAAEPCPEIVVEPRPRTRLLFGRWR
jgi:S-formylglutathione hydrolase FrmB